MIITELEKITSPILYMEKLEFHMFIELNNYLKWDSFWMFVFFSQLFDINKFFLVRSFIYFNCTA